MPEETWDEKHAKLLATIKSKRNDVAAAKKRMRDEWLEFRIAASTPFGRRRRRNRHQAVIKNAATCRRKWKEARRAYHEANRQLHISLRQLQDHIHGISSRKIAIAAGVPQQHLDTVRVKPEKNGRTSIYFGGKGNNPFGKGHAHYVVDGSGAVVWRREVGKRN